MGGNRCLFRRYNALRLSGTETLIVVTVPTELLYDPKGPK